MNVLRLSTMHNANAYVLRLSQIVDSNQIERQPSLRRPSMQSITIQNGNTNYFRYFYIWGTYKLLKTQFITNNFH